MDANKIIEEIISLDSQISELRDKFDELPEEARAQALSGFYEKARTDIGETDPLSIGLIRATDMICGLDDNAATILALGLDHPNADVRQLAGEALISIAEDGLDEIVPAIDAALKSGSPASEEMPFILAMIDDPAATEHITRFLDMDDLDTVVAAIESLAETRDPAAIPALKSLTEDTRTITLDAGDGDPEEMTIGRLAAEAIEMIDSED